MSEIKRMFNRVGLLGVAVQTPLTGEIIGWKPMEFTAEKQIKLLKFLSKLDLYGEVILRDSFDECLVKVEILDPGFTLVEAYRNTLEEAIAAVVNKRWEYLTEKQKQQIKEILDV